MTLDMMRMLLKKLNEEALYELMFVLLTVHRKAPFMENFASFSLLDMMIERWEDDREKIVEKFLEHLE